MGKLKEFEIPVQSLKLGIHTYQFEVDETFLGCFEETPVEKGRYTIKLKLDKQENEFLLDFDISGLFESPCDRCLADIAIPSQIEKLIWVKYSDEKAGQDHDEDVLYIANHEHSFNVSQLVYELIVLSLPMVRRYDCENDPNPKCDFKVLAYVQETEQEDNHENGLGDHLRNISY